MLASSEGCRHAVNVEVWSSRLPVPNPKALRTHDLRSLGPKDHIIKGFWAQRRYYVGFLAPESRL